MRRKIRCIFRAFVVPHPSSGVESTYSILRIFGDSLYHMRFNRFFRQTALFLVSISFPLTTFGATSLNVKAAEIVNRGDFLKAAIIDLGLSVDMRAAPQGTYTSTIPGNLKPYVRVAEKYNAMVAFESSSGQLRKAITRGEAALLLMKLRNLKPAGKDPLPFTDAGTGIWEDAARVAIEQGWMKPVRTNLFGASRSLTGLEAKQILNSYTKQGSIDTPPTTSTKSQSITVKFKPQQKVDLPKGDLLRTVWQLLNQQYLHTEKIDEKEAAYKAAEALVNSLQDPYTVFFRPADTQNFQEQIQGEVTGIGAQVEYANDALTVIAPISGSPALKAGVKAGDRITKVDGKSLAGLTLTQAVDKIRGPKGTTVKLTIMRDGTEIEISVTRDAVKLPEIDISMQDGIAVVRLVQFGQTTDTKLRQLLADVQLKNPKGLVLDLRNNPGGLLHAAEITLSNFLPVGSAVAVIKSKTEEYIEVTSDEPTIDAKIPIVVLANKGSASASEIVAGALQDHKRATVIGEKTFGKGTVQQIIEFNDGSSMKMTIAEWLTPKRRAINGVGLEPDVPVAAGDGTRDEVLLKALDLLR